MHQNSLNHSFYTFILHFFRKKKWKFFFSDHDKKILDFTGGYGVLNHGHNHPRIIKARIDFQNQNRMEIHKNYLSQYTAALSSNIANLLPSDLNKVYLPNSGAEANEGAIKLAYKLELKCGKKDLNDSKFLNEFPGEHYKILSSIVKITNAKKIVEIGTYTGLGTLSIKEGLSSPGKIITYDIINWNQLGLESHFTEEDFKDGSIEQILGDLSDDNFFEQNFGVQCD